MTDFRIRVIVDPTGAVRGSRRAEGELNRVGAAATRVQRLIAGAFAFTSLAVGVTALSRAADAVTNLENRLRLISSSSADVERRMQSLFEISNRTRSSFQSTGAIYSRVGLAARELGLETNQLERFTESLNQAVILSGASAREAEFALIQLSQGLASGALRGDELRSVLEQLPFVADVIAEELGVTRGALRELGADGAITAEIVLDAFENAGPRIAASFADTVPTISQSFVVLRNEATRLVAALDDAFGNASGALASVFLGLSNALGLFADNADEALTVLSALAAIATATFFQPFVTSTTSAIVSAVQFSAAVSSGNAVLLNSAEANRQKALSSLEASRADVTATSESLRLAQAQVSQLRSSQALIVSQRAQAQAQVELQTGVAAATGRTSSLVAAQASLNSSTRALLVTRRALRTAEVELTTAQQATAVATDRLAVSQGRYATAAAATSTITARLATQFPLLAAGINAAAAAASRLFAFFVANPFTAIVTALSLVAVGLSLMESRTERVERVTRSLEEVVDSVKAAYDRATGSVNEMAEGLQRITLTQTLQRQQEAAEAFRGQVIAISGELRQLEQRFFNTGPGSLENSFLGGLRQGLIDGTVAVEDLVRELDGIGQASPQIRGAVAEIIDMAQEAQGLEQASEEAAAAIRLLEGTATAADRALLGLGDSASNASRDVQNLGNEALNAVSSLRLLQSFVPELDNAARVQEQLNEAQTAFVQGRQDLLRRAGAGRSLDQVAKDVDELARTYERAKDEITGVAGAQRDANEALEAYTSATGIRALEGQSRAVAIARREYEELNAQLIESGASQRQLTEAQLAFESQLASIDRDFLDSESSGGGGRSSSNDDENLSSKSALIRQTLEGLAEEERLLRLTNDQRKVEEQLIDLQSRALENKVSLNDAELQAVRDRILQVQLLEQSFDTIDEASGTLFGGLDDAFEEFLKTGELNFKQFASNVVLELGRIATQALLIRPLIEGLSSASAGNGFTFESPNILGALGSIVNIGGNQFGGSVEIGGSGGPDSQLFVSKVSPGERVDFTPQGEGSPRGRGGDKFVFNITTPDVAGFRRSEAQIAASAARVLGQGKRNM